jgi:hypothetical protein
VTIPDRETTKTLVRRVEDALQGRAVYTVNKVTAGPVARYAALCRFPPFPVSQVPMFSSGHFQVFFTMHMPDELFMSDMSVAFNSASAAEEPLSSISGAFRVKTD